ADRTKIIEPTVADVFLSLGQERIDAYIKASLAAGDIIQTKALAAIQLLSRMTSALVIYLAVQAYIENQVPIETAVVNNSTTLRDFHGFLLEEAVKEDKQSQSQNFEEDLAICEEPEVYDAFEQEILRDIETIQDQI